MIEFNCPSCSKSYRVEDKHAGRSTACKQCGAKITIPNNAPAVTPAAPATPPAETSPRPVTVLEQPARPTINVTAQASNQPTGNGAALGMGIGALILGLLALLAAWIPIVGCISIPFSAIGLLLGIIGIILALTTRGKGIGFPIAGSIICLIAIGAVIIVNTLFAAAADSAADALADSVQEYADQRLVNQLEAAQQKLKDLTAKQNQVDAARARLDAFAVTRSSFAWSESSYITQPTISIAVHNGLDTAVSSLTMRAVLTSPGRSVAWAEGRFNYNITGGLEPGEAGEWDLSPSFSGDWRSTPKDRTDYVLDVEILQLKDAQGNPIFPDPLTDYERERLAELPAEIAELQQQVAQSQAAPRP